MKVGEAVGHKGIPFVYTPDPDNWVAPSLRIGIEVELENPARIGLSNGILAPFWEFQQDGSLRDNGFEIVLSDPLYGKDLTHAITLIEDLMAKHKFECNYRTGLHIHMDSREMEFSELERFFVIYALFEESIFNFVGDNRNSNNFCAPWSRISDHLTGVFDIFDKKWESEVLSPGSTSNAEIKANLSEIERYSALNCTALNKFGSLEFRHMQMSRDFVKIRRWINLIMSIYRASNLDSKWGPRLDVDTFIREISKGGTQEAARQIFPEWFIPFVTDKAVWNGILLVRDILPAPVIRAKFGDSSPNLVCPHKGTNKGLEIFLENLAPEGAS